MEVEVHNRRMQVEQLAQRLLHMVHLHRRDDFNDESEDDEYNNDEAMYDGHEDDSVYDDNFDVDSNDEFYGDGDLSMTFKETD